MKFLVKAFTLLAVANFVSAVAIQSRGRDILESIKRSSLWDYENDKIRGVNLGGWFVLEPYITPSLFQVFGSDNIPVDEYHYCQQLGKEVAQNRLETHWKTWYTEDDFKTISGFGLNMVRIPIGYWAFQLLDGDPYVQGQVKYIDQALEWARKYNLKVWIDLHGAPGSQNGFDNSGLRDTLEWQSGNNVQVTLDVLSAITEKYGGGEYQDVIIGIELLNEPLGPAYDMGGIVNFFEQGYKNVRKSSIQPVIVHDAFQAAGYWNSYFDVNDGYWDIVIDHHHYQVFSQGELQRSIDDHISTVCQWGIDSTNENHWNLCGEWSAALTDCAYWLNGVGRGARYSGDYENSAYIGSCEAYLDVSTWPSEYRTNVRKYIEAQLDAFELRSGWIFWNWKCEDAIEWDFKRLSAAGLFPNPLSERTYPNQCNF